MKIIETDFTVDGFSLKGTLHLPLSHMPPLVVGSHGLEGSRNSAKQMLLSKVLPENNIAFFRFDHRGCGESQGSFIKDTSIEKRARDFYAAVRHILEMEVTSNRIALFGSSMGGATCIKAWRDLERAGYGIQGAVLCASPVNTRTIKRIPLAGNAKRPTLSLDFFKDNLLYDLCDLAKALHHVIIFHGRADEVVPVENAHMLYAAMQPPKEMILHDGGDHQMTDRAHQQDFEQRMIAWYKSAFNL
ncbi:serine aminopeptidase domain-containing protein [uncultured Desulfobacter sp.]|uniref:alpha/beta hydrolase n=1 Tax=uncultured Desulfobacter sp. TaxID=240139 RepID=UPI0029F5737F|nr:alpha/beta hydrolase [uncultured Desulfobacter sp.]